MAGRLAVAAPDTVREAVELAYQRGNLFVFVTEATCGAAEVGIGSLSQADHKAKRHTEVLERIDAAREEATDAIDDALRLMRDELNRL